MMQRVRAVAHVGRIVLWRPGFAAFGLAPPSAVLQQPVVDKLVLSDTIQPVTRGRA